MNTRAKDVPDDVLDLLTERFGRLTPIGSGQWSVACSFSRGSETLVVRVGEHYHDFEVDKEISDRCRTALPVPEVLELAQLEPPHDHLHICVSTFVPGTPLESVSATDWASLVPAVADLLETMRDIDQPLTPTSSTWADTLCAPADPHNRFPNWMSDLEKRPEQLAAYEHSLARLLALSSIPHVRDIEPTLLHCDLTNRNVHVEADKIRGVFDWGCRRWGDHLYDFALFEFWAPWFPNLNIGLLKTELVHRWGTQPDPDRFEACLLHIGAEHLAYSAVLGDDKGGVELLDRMRALNLV